MLAAIFPQSNCHHGASVEYGANRGGASDAVLMTMLESPLKPGMKPCPDSSHCHQRSQTARMLLETAGTETASDGRQRNATAAPAQIC
jgi:hypothetical protein